MNGSDACAFKITFVTKVGIREDFGEPAKGMLTTVENDFLHEIPG